MATTISDDTSGYVYTNTPSLYATSTPAITTTRTLVTDDLVVHGVNVKDQIDMHDDMLSSVRYNITNMEKEIMSLKDGYSILKRENEILKSYIRKLILKFGVDKE